MSGGAAGEFVKSLREKLSSKKDRTQIKRNILQDSFNFILEILSKRTEIEIRSIRNFEINEIATYFDVFIPNDPYGTLSEILSDSGIKHTMKTLVDYRCVFIIDLEKRLMSSGEEHNMFSLEICSKRLNTYKIKISMCDADSCYSVFDTKYNEIKFWYYSDNNISIIPIDLREFNKNRSNQLKIKNIIEGLDAILKFNDGGYFESLELFQKKRKKISKSSYNITKIHSNE